MDRIPIDMYDSPIVILDLLYRLKVKDIMCDEIIAAKKTDTFRNIQVLLENKKITGVPIVEGTRLLGLVSMYDIIKAFDYAYVEEPVSSYMATNLIVLEEDMPISFAISYFGKYPYHRFPVLNIKNELVGMVTSRDITTRLLLEANSLIEELESNLNVETQSQLGHTFRQFLVVAMDFEKAGHASTEIKKLLKNDVDKKTLRRISIAAYELEMNIVVHSQGGKIILKLNDKQAEIIAIDEGPGIENLEKAVELGFSTASEFVRSLGFGAGMGLCNVKRVSDEFFIESSLSKGTEVKAIIYIHKEDEDVKS